MRTVRHPITMFVVVVLALIATGVGLLAATTNQRVYGPSWGRFTASFSGRVFRYLPHTSETIRTGSRSTALESTVTLRFSDFSYSTQRDFGWVAYAPLSGDVAPSDGQTVSVAKGDAMRQVVGEVRKLFSGPAVRDNEERSNGYSVTTIGPQCAEGQCTVAEVVSNGQVLWDLFATSKGPASTVESFIASFQPIA
jgi:hypothetical protein